MSVNLAPLTDDERRNVEAMQSSALNRISCALGLGCASFAEIATKAIAAIEANKIYREERLDRLSAQVSTTAERMERILKTAEFVSCSTYDVHGPQEHGVVVFDEPDKCDPTNKYALILFQLGAHSLGLKFKWNPREQWFN